MDADAPLLMSDVQVNQFLLTQNLDELPPMVAKVRDESNDDGLDQMASIFNGLWRAHTTSSSYRCTQRRICETLTAHQNLIYEPLIQTAT